MGRKRIHANAAARVRAYRSRLALLDHHPSPKCPMESRPPQLAEIEKEFRAVQAECETWLASLPESIKGTVRADMLSEVIGLLSAAADNFASVRPVSGQQP